MVGLMRRTPRLSVLACVALGGCFADDLALVSVSASRSEFQLVIDRIGGTVDVDNCTESDRRGTLTVELFERFGAESVDQTVVDVDVPARTSDSVFFEGLEPQQVGAHTLTVRFKDQEVQSGEFSVL